MKLVFKSSLLPIVKCFVSKAGVDVEKSDISLAGKSLIENNIIY